MQIARGRRQATAFLKKSTCAHRMATENSGREKVVVRWLPQWKQKKNWKKIDHVFPTT